MAKFELRNGKIFQLPTGNNLEGFVVPLSDEYNLKNIIRCLNQDDEIKDLAAWLLRQKTLYISEKRRELLRKIAGCYVKENQG